MEELRRKTRAYTARSNGRAWLEFLGTLFVYALCLLASIVLWPDTKAVSLICLVFYALAATRLYMVQHDCGHGALFETRKLNDLVGSVISVFTLTPYQATKFNHNLHHAHIGNLDEREANEIYTLTVSEYLSKPLWFRAGYHVYRHPLTLFLIGPVLIFVLRYRLPKNWSKTGLLNVLVHDVVLVAYWLGMHLAFGWTATGLMAAGTVISLSWGTFIPYVQHNFEDVYFERAENVDFATAAVKGSAVMDFGRVYDFLTANIAYHDLHHLNSNIPYYNLRRCHVDLQPLLQSKTISVTEALSSLRWKLWDEEAGKMVPFPARSMA